MRMDTTNGLAGLGRGEYYGVVWVVSIHLSGKFPFRLTIINRKSASAVT